MKDPVYRLQCTSTAPQVAASGDLGYSRGTYRFRYTANGQPAEEAGKYVVVWKKWNGAWKVAVDVWNTDAPATPTQ
jgi:ketosteroid isomerase-like protein